MALLTGSAHAGAPEAAAAVILDSLVIRVYDNAGVPVAERGRAMSRAYSILSRADIAVDWIDCPARKYGRQSAHCSTPPGRAELIVRLMNAPTRADGGPARNALGYTLIDMASGTGTVATVYVDRVRSLAEGARIDRATVLGRALAHEIGHLILGSNDHSDSGIMRATWTARQLTNGKPQDWLFLPSQSEQLRQARLLSGSGSRTATVETADGPPGG